MEKMYSKHVNFQLADDTTVAEVTEIEEFFNHKTKEEACRPALSKIVAEESSPEIIDLILKHYGHRLCLKQEVCEIDTQTNRCVQRVTDVPSDESFTDIIDLVLRVYGDQRGKTNKTCINTQNSTADLAAKESKATQTILEVKPIDRFTNTREYDTSVRLLQGVCFRFFFGPSLDETGVHFGVNFPIIRQFLDTLKSKIFTDQQEYAERSLNSRIDPDMSI